MKAFFFLSLVFYINQCNSIRQRFVILDNLPIYVDTDYKVNWFQAWNECASRNMNLISLDSEEKSKDLENALREDCVSIIPFAMLGVKHQMNCKVSMRCLTTHARDNCDTKDMVAHKVHSIRACME
uniref:Salivary C-type lectin n=1 Tax=Glossina morsitans morsitans TaxID=37546 RepID=D3TR85_GLOMM